MFVCVCVCGGGGGVRGNCAELISVQVSMSIYAPGKARTRSTQSLQTYPRASSVVLMVVVALLLLYLSPSQDLDYGHSYWGRQDGRGWRGVRGAGGAGTEAGE